MNAGKILCNIFLDPYLGLQHIGKSHLKNVFLKIKFAQKWVVLYPENSQFLFLRDEYLLAQ